MNNSALIRMVIIIKAWLNEYRIDVINYPPYRLHSMVARGDAVIAANL